LFGWNFTPPGQFKPQKFADPMIGTDAHGHTFPGATVPFGMVQLSPDTRLDGWDGCSGYHYSDTFIYGFSHTHLSGTGCSDYGDILLTPAAARPPLYNGANGKAGYRFSFAHKNEHAEAGYYSVKGDNGIFCELTASPRTGVHRYTFPQGAEAHLLVDLVHRDAVTSSGLRIENDSTISGWRHSEAWARDQKLWFSATFSAPFTAEMFGNDSAKTGSELSGKALKAILKFGRLSKPLEVKLALSPVSTSNAAQNRQAETAGMNFDAVRAKATDHWNSVLGKIEVKSNSETQQRIFYSALYHCYISPNVYSDVNGEYRGPDGNVHRDTTREHYTVFSLWDTYRTLHPLFTILEPARTADFIHTFTDFHRQSKRLPMWELSANETNCMIGYHGVSVIADAWTKGIRNYDTLAALQAMLETGNGNYRVQPAFRENGFVPGEEAESVSQTLEYAYDDWCIAKIAARAGNKKEAENFGLRAQYWKNLFDPQTKFFRARRRNQFTEPFIPEEVNIHYTEANAWHYSLYVPQSINELKTLHGGDEQLTAFIDKLFTSQSETSGREQADITGRIGQYAHGNEPSHHTAYLYAWTGHHWKTQQRVREICETLYTDKPDGLCGNDDCGQLSAWAVMSMAGFYPVTPGQPLYVIGAPQFEKIIFHLDNQKTFTISTGGKGNYISSARFNNQDYNKVWISHESIINGGELNFTLSETPDKKWGAAPEMRPPTPAETGSLTLSPRIVSLKEDFGKSLQLTFFTPQEGAEIFWKKKEETEWKKYSSTLNSGYGNYLVFATRPGAAHSDTLSMNFVRPPAWKGINCNKDYAPQYAASGPRALIDGINGTSDFRTGDWQGFAEKEVEWIIDLDGKTNVQNVAVDFLHDQRSWIFLPREVEFLISSDGKNFTSVSVDKKNFDDHTGDPKIMPYTAVINKDITHLKIIARGLGICPEWHLGKGNRAWMFADEIVITPSK
jgi:predicted alpha-1,2-mannosidase